ncbi:gephyrin-like molybdotransferase Glp [Lacibacterium aquatile]|uniref:Molybdopterin molybdenumtransferase n=1 Tax=Lacibacterium aquatile TaxID=1168082 RepID=A0ABW5DPN0_9PROT
MLPVADAQSQLLARIARQSPLAAEDIALTEAAGRVLAEDLLARVSQPPADVSAMDGWALRGDDIASLPARLKPVAAVAAGHPVDTEITPGTCARIFTGAPLPPGADTVVLQEDCTILEDGSVEITDGRPGRHVRKFGLDFQAGGTVLQAGRTLTARDVGLAAASGHPWLRVHRRPRVALLATGDEVVRPGDPLAPGQIVSANSYMLAALVRAAGGDPIILGIARDEDADVRRLAAAAKGCDILVTTGGASVGEHDRVQAALGEIGLTLDFWKIAMRPGKPLMIGGLGDMVLIGLPGNPVSAYVCGLLFLAPAIRALQGDPAPLPLLTEAELAVDLGANDHRQDYVRSRLTLRNGALPLVEPARPQDSSMMSILAESGALLVRPPHDPARKAGDRVTILGGLI